MISKPDFFIRPMIDNMVSATLSAQLSTHTPTQQAVTVPSTADTTSIEEMPLSIYIYQGRDTVGDYGSAWINYLVREDGETVTEFKYSLPEQEQGYAGLIYRFSEPQDITEYKYIEIKASFNDGAVCDFWLIDDYENKKEVHIGDGITPDGDISISVNDRVQTITIPLKTNFEPVVLRDVIQVEFAVGTYLSRGQNRFVIESIRFIPK